MEFNSGFKGLKSTVKQGVLCYKTLNEGYTYGGTVSVRAAVLKFGKRTLNGGQTLVLPGD